MTKVTYIDAKSGTPVVKGAIEKLAAYAAELGLAVEQEGRWSYDRSGKFLVLKVKFAVGGDDGLDELSKIEFARFATYYGLEPRDYGAIITIRGTKYRLVKINTRARVRYPFECEAVGAGKGIRLPEVYKHEIIAARR